MSIALSLPLQQQLFCCEYFCCSIVHIFYCVMLEVTQRWGLNSSFVLLFILKRDIFFKILNIQLKSNSVVTFYEVFHIFINTEDVENIKDNDPMYLFST
jgi:hypothetical protein